jgi:hypothetical protein
MEGVCDSLVDLCVCVRERAASCGIQRHTRSSNPDGAGAGSGDFVPVMFGIHVLVRWVPGEYTH